MIKCWNFFQEKNYSKTGFTRRLNWYDSSIYIKTRIIKFWLSRSNSFMDSITTHCYARWNAKIIKFWFKFLRRKIDTIHTQLAIIIIIVRDKTRYDNIIRFWQIVPFEFEFEEGTILWKDWQDFSTSYHHPFEN